MNPALPYIDPEHETQTLNISIPKILDPKPYI